jgi:sugar lactone lactonase YvrE
MTRSGLQGLLGAVSFAWLGLAQAQALLPGERPASVAGIPGVIAAGATWELVWADFQTADGIVATPDGGVLFAQEQTDTLRRLDAQNRETVFLTGTKGAGAVSVDAQGRVFVVQRTCTDPGKPFSASCSELTRVAQVAPEQRLLASAFPDGRPLGRLNDLIADGKGGAYFTVDAPISVVFPGNEKRVLYVPMMGAVGPDGKAWATPQGVRNTAMTIYRIPMLSQGLMARPK